MKPKINHVKYKFKHKTEELKVNLYFMPIFPIGTPLLPTPPTSLGDPGESGFFWGDAYVSDIWGLKNLGISLDFGKFPQI